jgi:hypothetical protein
MTEPTRGATQYRMLLPHLSRPLIVTVRLLDAAVA